MAAAGDLPRPGLLRLSQDNLLLNLTLFCLAESVSAKKGKKQQTLHLAEFLSPGMSGGNWADEDPEAEGALSSDAPARVKWSACWLPPCLCDPRLG